MAPVKQCILLQIEKVAKSIKDYLVWHMFTIEDTVTHLVTSSPGGILTKSKPDNEKLLKEVYSSISTKKKKKLVQTSLTKPTPTKKACTLIL